MSRRREVEKGRAGGDVVYILLREVGQDSLEE